MFVAQRHKATPKFSLSTSLGVLVAPFLSAYFTACYTPHPKSLTWHFDSMIYEIPGTLPVVSLFRFAFDNPLNLRMVAVSKGVTTDGHLTLFGLH